MNNLALKATVSSGMSMAPGNLRYYCLELEEARIINDNGFNRLVIEKFLFGRDFESAKKLNDELSQTFSENQIFRIDHYLVRKWFKHSSITFW